MMSKGKGKKLQRLNHVQSVHRALTILNAVAKHPEGVGVRDVARQVGLKAPTAHALIRTLEQATYLEADPSTRKYHLGIGAVLLGFGVGSGWNTRIAATVHDLLEDLGRKLDETVVLFGFVNGFVVCLDAITRQRELAVHMRSGNFFQIPHEMANGKVLLSHCDASFQEHYAEDKQMRGLLGEEFSNAREMLAEFAKIRKHGCGEVNNLHNSGIYAIGVPVKGFFGRYDLSIGTCLPSSRMNPEKRREFLSVLEKTAAAMDRRIEDFTNKRMK